MTKKILAVVFLLSSLSLGQLFQPKLMVQPGEYDFGVIEQGEMVSHTFILTNGGSDLLKISNVTASCGCTAAKPEKQELAPGESTNLLVTFNSAHRQGSQFKTVKVTSNDPENPEVTLSIKANVVLPNKNNTASPVIYFPEVQHNFGKTTEGKVLEHSFIFRNTGGSTLSIKEIKTSCGCTAALVSKENLQPGEEGSIKVEFDTSNRVGKMSKTITVLSNDPLAPNKVLTIYAEVEKAG